MDISGWLQGLGLAQYEQAFRDNDIDLDVLQRLTVEDLRELGVSSVGHRRRLLDAIAAMAEPPATLAAAAPESSQQISSGAERRQLTVMFCDLVGSTQIAAQLDPEDVREMIGAYHQCVAEAISQHGGFIAKYMGDGVLMYFGYPLAHEDDAERSVRAGLRVIERVARLKAARPLEARVGIATGLVVVGDLIGAGEAQERGVVGGTPNLAARLQGLAAPGGLLIDSTTRRLIGDLFEYEELGPIDIRGFEAPVQAWSVLRPSTVESRFEALRAVPLTPLIGRNQQIDLLERCWKQARTGAGQVILVSGEPGIGKSRLAEALQSRIGAAPHIRIRYFCSPHSRDTALHPFIAQLERAAQIENGDLVEARLDKLEALLNRSGEADSLTLGLLAHLMGLSDGGRYPLPQDPQQRRDATLAALVNQLKALGRRSPVIMLFEDAHWVDSTSLELLDRIITELPRLPVLLVVTFRPEFEPKWVGRPHVLSVVLNRLAQVETTAMVDEITGGKQLPPELLDRIVERTDGIPLFIEELTKTLLEGGLLREEKDRYTLAAPLPQLAIPSSLQASLLERLDRLMPIKEVAQIGAAIGREFSYELVSRVARRSETELTDALDKLVDAGLIFRRGHPPRANFLFKHALVQDAAYSTLLRSQRQALHSRIGRTLEEHFPDVTTNQPEVLGHHFTEAGLNEPAVEYWRKAGERALTRSANAEAVSHLAKGIELIRSLPEGSQRDCSEFALYLAYGPATRAVKGQGATETLEVFSHARDLITGGTTTRERVFILYGLWGIHLNRLTHVEELEIAEECVEITCDDADIEASALANRMMGRTLAVMGKFKKAAEHLQKTVDLCIIGKGNSSDLRFSHDHHATALGYLAFTLFILGYPDKAFVTSQEALKQAQNIRHAATTANVLTNRACLTAGYGADLEIGKVDVRRGIDYAVEHGQRSYESWCRWFNGNLLTAAGEQNLAIEELLRALQIAKDTNTFLWFPMDLGYLGSAYAAIGDLNAGRKYLDEGIEAANNSEERIFEAELLRRRGETFVQSEPELAEADFLRALEIARSQDARLWELRAAVSLAMMWRAAGKRQDAFNLLSPVYADFTEGLETADLKRAKQLIDALA